ncbi:MAG: YggS family pyridoxal phosphate-dependent enzyme [Acidobacteria bacterium]|nr:MAG: YggS family pyridoxal phosphate-dependent enzyme [Acidobacteriota bacterium]
MIADRVAAVRERIARAAARVGRPAGDVTLVAVAKTHPPEAVREAFAAGVRDVGENRVQEAEGKAAALADLRPQGLRWHLVGHLQSNKAKKAAALFDWVHSLDGAPIARRLGQAAAAEDRKLSALVQVDLASEPTKSGLDEAQLFPTLESLRGLPAVSVLGLMALPPYEEEPERVRPYFRQLRVLRDRARQQGLLEGAELSMGMSHDLEVAVEEGATLVRVGTAIFGERHG